MTNANGNVGALTPETAAAMLQRSGYSFVPTKIDGTKAASVDWTPYQSKRPTPEEVTGWFGGGKTRGIAIVMGEISGNAETIDFDKADLFVPFCTELEKRAPGLLARLVQVDTPRPGYQITYRCKQIGRNQELAFAERLATAEEIEKKRAYENERGDLVVRYASIETRGEGGYVIAVGSPARVHKNKKPYRFRNLDYEHAPMITVPERDIIFSICESLSELPIAPESAGDNETETRRRERKPGDPLLPGDDYNERADHEAELKRWGWSYFGDSRKGTLWTRPGKDVEEGNSATLFPNGNLFVHSSNAHPLLQCDRHAITPFARYALYDHKGDFKAAAKALAAAGYGDRHKSKAGADSKNDQPRAEGQEKNAGASIPDLGLFEGKLKLRFKRLPSGEVNIEVESEGALIHQDQVDLQRDTRRVRFLKRIAKSVSLTEDQSAEIEKSLLLKSKEIEKLIEGESKKERKDKPKSGAASIKEVGKIHFEVSERGVWATEENGSNTWVCSQLIIEADTRDERNESWGRLLRFPDRDGVWHTWSMPMALLGRDGGEYREHLLNLGLDIGGRKSRTLLESYLNVNPDKRALCVIRPGWHRGGFVLPDEFIGGQDAEPIYLQTFNANHLFRQSGSADEWREKLGVLCRGNKRLILSVSVAFCAPLLDPLQGESGGWHFTSDTSMGKSTALYVAGSVHGGGGDKGFLRRWRATINGLESVAESHHDSLLCLDEIAECKPEDVNEAAYMLSNGQGKARQARAGGLRGTPEWRAVFLSSGEISLADHIAQSGRRVRGGQEVRVVNLPADARKGFGLFEDLHGKPDGDAFARYLQKSARECYGAPIRSFLRNIVGRLDELRKLYKTFADEVLKEMLPDKPVGAVSRVAHRFALAAFAGELATEIGLTGWEPEEATDAAKALFQVWLEARGTSGSTDEEAAVRQVRAFLEQHGSSRFQRLRPPVKVNVDGVANADEENLVSDDRAVINRAGFVKPDSEGAISEYFIAPEVFRSEVCKGFDYRMVARALQSRGLLITDRKPDCLTRRQRTPEGSLGFYCVSNQIHEKG